jgi:hypothetical protein
MSCIPAKGQPFILNFLSIDSLYNLVLIKASYSSLLSLLYRHLTIITTVQIQTSQLYSRDSLACCIHWTTVGQTQTICPCVNDRNAKMISKKTTEKHQKTSQRKKNNSRLTKENEWIASLRYGKSLSLNSFNNRLHVIAMHPDSRTRVLVYSPDLLRGSRNRSWS